MNIARAYSSHLRWLKINVAQILEAKCPPPYRIEQVSIFTFGYGRKESPDLGASKRQLSHIAVAGDSAVAAPLSHAEPLQLSEEAGRDHLQGMSKGPRWVRVLMAVQ